MKLPNAENSFIDKEKLIGYCLNDEHYTGKHKARVFSSVLNINSNNYLVLESAIKENILVSDAIFVKKSKYGELFYVDFLMSYLTKSANIRTSWIIKTGEDFPRMTSCYIINKGENNG